MQGRYVPIKTEHLYSVIEQVGLGVWDLFILCRVYDVVFSKLDHMYASQEQT